MIYLDTNATARPAPAALAAVCEQARRCGNASSPHQLGQAARRVLEEGRAVLREALGAQSADVIFTSGGTEADHLGVIGLARARRQAHGCTTVWLSALEHPAVQAAAGLLERDGFTLRRFAILPNGQIDPEFEVHERVAVVAVMLAHNETGVVQPVRTVVDRALTAGVPVHVDAVQAMGKMHFGFDEMGATSLAVAAHKFGGPRGIGALVVRRPATAEPVRVDLICSPRPTRGRGVGGVGVGSARARARESMEPETGLEPLWRGGAQQEGRRPGTEAAALVAGMTAALRALGDPAHLAALRDRLEGQLTTVPGSSVLGALAPRLANTSAMRFDGVKGLALLHGAADTGVMIGLGAACHGDRPSPVLTAMGLGANGAAEVVRFSVGWHNTAAEIDEAAEVLTRAIAQVRKAS